MATDKTKVEKEYTVEDRLKALYELQTMLSEIDRIKTLRGELPLEVQDQMCIRDRLYSPCSTSLVCNKLRF